MQKKDVQQTSSHKLLFEPSISNALLKHLKRKGYKINLIMYNQRNKKNFSYWNLNIYSFWSSIWTFFREFFFWLVEVFDMIELKIRAKL